MAIKYSGDANLIKGAAAAYKNYDNIPEIYAGFQSKIQKAGAELIKAQERINLQKEAQNQRTDAVIEKVKSSAGGFYTSKDFDETSNYLEKVKQELITAQNNKDKKGIAAAEAKLKAEINYIQSVQTFRKNVSSKEFRPSNAMRNAGKIDGNNGRQQDIFNAFLDEDFDIIEEDGKRYYTGEFNVEGQDAEGNPNTFTWKATFEEIQDMYIPEDKTINQSFMRVLESRSNPRNSKPDINFIYSDLESIIPTDTKSLRAFTSDKINEQTFSQILDDGDLEVEILNTFKDKQDADIISGIRGLGNKDSNYADDGSLDQQDIDEYKNAVVDPYHSFWLDENDEPNFEKWKRYCRPILKEKLANAVLNQWDAEKRKQTRSDYE